MKRFLLPLVLLFFVLEAGAQVKTVVTANIQDVTGIVATSGYIEFKLKPSSRSTLYRIAGSFLVAAQTARCGIDVLGEIKNLTLTGACEVWGTDLITPGNLAYDLKLAPNNKVTNTIRGLLISGATYTLTSPTFAPEISIVPEFQTITTDPISANIIPGADGVFNLGQDGKRWAAAYLDNLFVLNGLALPFPAVSSFGEIVTGVFNSVRVVDGVRFLTLAAAVSGFTDGTIFLPPGTHNVTADLTIPAGVTLVFAGNAQVSVSSTFTLTISGPMEAPLDQIFSGVGSVVFDPVKGIVYPEWWGALKDGTDAAAALQAAVDSVGDTAAGRRGGTTVDLSGPISIASTVTIRRKSIILQCHGWGDDADTDPESGYIKWIGTRTSSTISAAGVPGADRTTNVVTITTTAAHSISIRDLVTVSGVTDSSFDGTFLVASVPTTTTFTYAQTDSNGTSGGGTASFGTPMIEFRDTRGGGGIRDCKFIGDTTNPPEAAISMYETNDSQPNSRNLFSNIEITSPSGNGFDTGIRFHGDLNTNNAESLFENIFIQGCVDSGIRIGGTQMVLNKFSNLNIQGCANGVWASAGFNADNIFFANNGADLFTPSTDEFGNSAFPRIQILRFQSELGGRMVEIKGPIILNVRGGSWQISANTNSDGKIISAQNNNAHVVRLEDFEFRQDSAPPTAPFLAIETVSAGASSNDIVLDGIRGWGALTGGTNGMTAATHGPTDRSYVYLRRITDGAGASVVKIALDRRAGFSGTQQWDINRYEPEGPRLALFRKATFTDVDTTPSVADGNWFTVSNTSATTVTTFGDGVDGQVIHLRFTNGNTTLADGATLNLRNGADVNPTTDEILSFIFNGANWYEITPDTRTVNPLEGTLANQPRWIFKQVDFGDMTASATADTFTLWTLPANTEIRDVYATVVTGWSGGSISAAVCSVGTTGSANDLTLDDNFFTTGTRYDLHDATANGGKGALLFDATDKFAPHMYVVGGDIEIQCDLTGDNHANATAGQARIYILVSQPLGNTTVEAN